MAAQATISTTDSVARRIGPHSVDSTLIVTLVDGDYARFLVMHPTGVAIDIIKPNGERVGRFIAPEDAAGADAVEFVAEGAGPYAVAVGNTADTAVHTTIAFQERLSLDERTRPVPWRDDVASPKIQEVRRQIDSGRTNTADFWSMVARGGTPLIEPLDARYDLVTFLWRAEHDTRNVYFIGSVRTPNGPNDALHQLGKTDIWYLTLPVPKGARFYYGLEPNRPSPGFARVTRQADPFNRGVKYDCGAGASKYECRSIGELPEAPLKPWIAHRADDPAGRIERQKIHSALQNVERDLTIYTPAGYTRAGKPASLVVLFDGDQYLDSTWHGPETWDHLISAKKIPPTVVVMVHNLPGRRVFDLVANPTFGDFMAKELVPWMRLHYNVSPKASRTLVGGASAGGFGAAYLGLAHPEVFGNVVSVSGAFWWSPEHNGGICAGVCKDPGGKPAAINRDATTEPNWIAKLALERPAAPVRFYLAAGTFEFDWDGTGAGILPETRHLRDILRAKNYRVGYEQFVGGHDGLSWPGAMANGIESLLGNAR
jgi:enterochelin esterase-like enzyme